MVAKTNNKSNSKDGAERIRSEGGRQAALKKGPWTAAEDTILMEYVRKHGEGNWNAVQRSCGLSRCGKSCRLRWANHLRPNLKKGSFTPDEERLIIELHSKIGNKWARMASQLPGRTDNEIKNYWNTRVKRLQRAGLPIYPDDIPPNYQNHPQNGQTNPNSPISPPPYSSQFNTYLSFLNPILNFPTLINPPFLPHSFIGNRRVNLDRALVPSGSIGNLPMPLISSMSPFASPPLSLCGQNIRMGGTFSPFGIVNGPGKIELSSIQTHATSLVPSTSASSATTDSASWADNIIATRGEGYYASNALEEGNNNNSGLLETLLEESNAIAQAQKLKSEDLFRNGLLKEISEEGDSNHGPNSSPLYSSCGMKEEPMEETNHLDDDLSSLLNNFVQVPDWYDATTTTIATNSSTSTKWDTRSCCWKNMPSVR